jgi:hypothetical protein
MITTTWQIQRKAPATETMAGEWLPCGLTQRHEEYARQALNLWRQGRPRDRFRLVRRTETTEVVE